MTNTSSWDSVLNKSVETQETFNKNGSFDSQPLFYERFGFVSSRPELAIPTVVVLILASAVGTFGNVLILFAVATKKMLRNVESIFIVNLAMSDLFVTTVGQPMSILGRLTCD